MEAAGCTSCGASGSALARCGRCKWPRYCSKSCQRSHWSSRHRRECATLAACGQFRDLERQFWTSERAKQLDDGLRPESMVRSKLGPLIVAVNSRVCAAVLWRGAVPGARAQGVRHAVEPAAAVAVELRGGGRG